jgi:hypothetical protein
VYKELDFSTKLSSFSSCVALEFPMMGGVYLAAIVAVAVAVVVAAAAAFIAVDNIPAKVSMNKINMFPCYADLSISTSATTSSRHRRDPFLSAPQPSPLTSISIMQPPVLLQASARWLPLWCCLDGSASTCVIESPNSDGPHVPVIVIMTSDNRTYVPHNLKGLLSSEQDPITGVLQYYNSLFKIPTE